MSKHSAANDRTLRLELIRARAALERQSLARDTHELGQALRPSALVKSLFMRHDPRERASDLLARGLALGRRYPLVSSGASTLLARAGRRNRLIRAGTSIWFAWQFWRSLQGRRKRRRRL